MKMEYRYQHKEEKVVSWNYGSYAGGFSLGTNPSNAVGVKTLHLPTEPGKEKVRAVDANELICEMVELFGKGYDDDTIEACINVVKNRPTIKRKFLKWRKVNNKRKPEQ